MSRLSEKRNRPVRKNLAHVSRFALSFALCFAPLIESAQARAKVGVASAVIPQARLGETPQELEIIAVGDRVDQDVLIETGVRGRTQVLFVDGSSMNIGPSSRIIIDEFVFDPSQLDGNLGARIEKGSMRFIGGVLSKRANQVKFNAGEATVGIRGGIAKIALASDGKLKAELVHGRLSVATPEGLFETDRIGTLIEREPEGEVVTRSVTVEETKGELDDEAKENLIEPEAEEAEAEAAEATPTATTGDETASDATADTEAASNEDDASVGDETVGETVPEDTGDVLVDNPVDSGLVEIGEDGKLEATAELAEIDPDAAKLINEGGVAIDENGTIVPTARMLELDPTAQAMFDEGLLEVDENGFLVAAESFEQDNFYEEVSFTETDDKQVSEATLKEFGFEEVEVLSTEDLYKSNIVATRSVLAGDETAAKLYEAGQLEIDENGLLKPSNDFNPLLAARAERAVLRSSVSFVDDNAADKLLLNTGVFDTKITTRVVGTELATVFYDEEITKVVSADIVREDALDAITKLAGANGLALPDNIEAKGLDDLVALGGALSTRDALKTSIGVGSVNYDEPVAEVDVGEDGKVVLRTIGDDGKIEETDAEAALVNLASGSIDIEFASKFVSDEELVALLPVIEANQEETKESDTGAIDKVESTDIASRLIAIGVDTDKVADLTTRIEIVSVKEEDTDLSNFIGIDTNTRSATIDLGEADFIDAGAGEDFPTETAKADDGIDTSGFDEKTEFAPEIADVTSENIIDFGKESFIGGLGEEFVDKTATDIGVASYLEPTVEVKPDDYAGDEKVDVEPTLDEKDALISKQVEEENERQAEKIATAQGQTVTQNHRFSIAGQRLADTGIWGSRTGAYWMAYSSLGQSDLSDPVETRANQLRLLANGEVNLSMQATTMDETTGYENRLSMPVTPVGEATDLLAQNSYKFKAALDFVVGFRNGSSTEVTQTITTHKISDLQRSSDIELCKCDQVSTGIWETETFTDRALGSLTYRHKGHWAIGSPLSSDELRALSGMRASFQGHAYGTVATSRGVADGFGRVAVSVDFANPTDSARNSFELSDFRADNLSSAVNQSVTLQPEYDRSGQITGHYGGASESMRVDGGVYGSLNNLQTGGTFTVKNAGVERAQISGSFAGAGAAQR